MRDLREQIHSVLDTSSQPNLAPHEMADLLVQLTALYASLSEEVLAREFRYKAVLRTHMEKEEAASRAKINAETTGEYRDWREAQTLERSMVEHIRSLKKSLDVRNNERWMTR